MRPRRTCRIHRCRPLLALTALVAGLLGTSANVRADDGPEARALAFLAVEVPAWSRENGCFSCHNNGDAARALAEAKVAGLGDAASLRESMADTLGWLARPEAWDRKPDPAAMGDPRLARIEFAAALVAAVEAGWLEDRASLRHAAERLANDQSADGSWPIDGDADGLIGSPATYGGPLATWAARDILRAADAERHADAIRRAGDWLRTRPIRNVPDAAAAVAASRGPGFADASAEALALIREAESDGGGWGPFRGVPPEPFDTAVVLLALTGLDPDPAIRPMVERGRAYLIASEQDSGAWPETTRPRGGRSYAQRISTAGWATRALIATRRWLDEPARPSPPIEGPNQVPQAGRPIHALKSNGPEPHLAGLLRESDVGERPVRADNRTRPGRTCRDRQPHP